MVIVAYYALSSFYIIWGLSCFFTWGHTYTNTFGFLLDFLRPKIVFTMQYIINETRRTKGIRFIQSSPVRKKAQFQISAHCKHTLVYQISNALCQLIQMHIYSLMWYLFYTISDYLPTLLLANFPFFTHIFSYSVPSSIIEYTNVFVHFLSNHT